jgi:hypothetical protein
MQHRASILHQQIGAKFRTASQLSLIQTSARVQLLNAALCSRGQ